MLKKVQTQLKNHKSECIKTCGLAIGVFTIAFVSYRLGAQHGVNVVDAWLLKVDPDLHEQVDALYRNVLG